MKNEGNYLPREKLKAFGAPALNDEELLAILIGFGAKGHPVNKIAGKLRKIIDERNGDLKIDDLGKTPGIGLAKGAIILAALEFVRRRIRADGVKIREASDVIPLVQHLADRRQEHFVCISLNGAHEVITTRIITIGLVNSSQVHPREVFSDPITDRACAVIVAHNHPSGELEPSEEDLVVTRRLKEAGQVLGIKLLDHVIFSKRGYLSLNERGIIK